MTRKEEIKELESALRTVTNPFRDYSLETEAEIMIDDGWHKQIEAEWTPVEKLVPDWGANIIHHYECSNCKTLEYTNDRKYCSYCGAKMTIKGE